MTDRRSYVPVGRAATYNPARTSLPNSIGYNSLYGGDVQLMPASSRHPVTTPRGYTTATAASGVPTTTRTYAVNNDPRYRSGPRDSSRSRRSTLDSSMRPPVIVTTTQQDRDRSHGHSSYSAHPRNGSPIREAYRSGDGNYYAQPASSIRSRSTARPYHGHAASEDFGRPKDSLLSPRDAESYRSSRPSVVYPSDPRHSTAAIDYGEDGYKYTNAGELVKYDLDMDQAKPARSRRHESFDRGYYRPNVNYNADLHSLNVNTGHDSGRNYYPQTARPYDDRGGPPPSTRGFDRLGRGYDASREVPPSAPAPPTPTPSSQLELSGKDSDRRDGRRARPVSLYHDGPSRPAQYDDYYRSRDDERSAREPRDRQRDRGPHSPQFQDQSVPTRGFGIRTSPPAQFDDRRDPRYEPRREGTTRRSDEELARSSDVDREDRRRRSWQPEEPRDRRESKRPDSDDNEERSHIREKMGVGLGVAAAAVGLVPSAKQNEGLDKEDKETPPRRSPDGARVRREGPQDPERSPALVQDTDDGRLGAGRSKGDAGPAREPSRVRDDAGRPERYRQDAESKLNNEVAVVTPSDSEDGGRASRRHRASSAFNPNDASDLRQIKEQLATMDISERNSERERERERPLNGSFDRERPEKGGSERERDRDRDRDRDRERERENPIVEQRERARSPSPVKEDRIVVPLRDESRGRELDIPSHEKQVRVVSPPRDKKDDKPIKSILKQPKSSFPEDRNPIREGVAPHKEDKKLKEAPPGARWTKINRKIVNPEALSIGKERFEVRDDFVIVLRVLSKEEIEAYAAATQVLRERRRNKDNGDGERDDGRKQERDREDDGGQRHHRHHRRRDDEEESDGKERDRDRDRDRDRERRRRYRREDDDAYDSVSKEPEHHHHRSHRDRDRAAEV